MHITPFSLGTGLGSVASVEPLNSSGCPLYEENGAYYCHVIEQQKSVSGGISLWGEQSQQAPFVDPTDVAAHSLSQIWVSTGPTEYSDAEYGWEVDPGRWPTDDPNNPHLFVSYVDGGGPHVRDPPYEPGNPETKWIPYSGATEAPGEPLTYADQFHEYGVEKDSSGNWWFYHDSNWLGYFPAHDWTVKPFTSYTEAEVGGEVDDDTSQVCSQMGNGEVGTSGTAAMWREVLKETEGGSDTYLVPTAYHDEEGAPIYTYGNTDSEIGQFRYGGDGFTACDWETPPTLDWPPEIPYPYKPEVNVPQASEPGAWISSPTSYSYQWNRCTESTCEAIPGANGSSYTPVLEDQGHKLTVTETAYNGYGQSSGTSLKSLAVPYVPPLTITEPAAEVSEASAELKGFLDPNGSETHYHFEYGTNIEYGKDVPEPSGDAGSGLTGSPEAYTITGLSPHTTYHFRIVASNTGGASNGEDESFTTLSKPSAETTSATGITETGATLNGKVDPWSSETKYSFQYGPTTSYGSTTPEAGAGSGTSNEEESKAITGLKANKRYHFRVVATNGSGTTYGEDHVFITHASVGEYTLPLGDESEQVTVGSDGNLWFTDWHTSKIGRMTTSGEVEEYALPAIKGTWESAPAGIVAGPEKEKALWFTDHGSSKIGRITTSGEIKEYELPSTSDPAGIVAGPEKEKALWFTESGTSRIGRITTEGEIKEYELPTKGSGTTGIILGPEGYLWFTNAYTSKIGRIIPSSHEIKEYTLPAESRPDGIVAGPEGYMWFADALSGKIGRINPSNEEIKEYELPAGSHPRSIVAGPEGDLWLTEPSSNKIVQITTSGSITTEYTQPTGSNPFGITVGPESNVWFTDDGDGKVGTIELSRGAEEYPLPLGDDSEQVTTGPDGNLWFTDWHTSKIGRMTTSGEVEEYGLPATKVTWESAPAGIVAGPEKEKALWFTDHGSSKIGRITTSGEIKEYELPLTSDPAGIVAGPEKEKALWFTESGTSRIGRITTEGEIKEYELPTKGSGTTGIALGPEGYLWFTNPYTSKIGRIIPSSHEIKEYNLPAESRPDGIVAGPEGYMWFVDALSGKIGRINPSNEEIKEYELPAGSHPRSIVAGPEGDLWLTEPSSNKIVQITTSGSITAEYTQPTGSNPFGITVGPESHVWFTDDGDGRIGMVVAP